MLHNTRHRSLPRKPDPKITARKEEKARDRYRWFSVFRRPFDVRRLGAINRYGFEVAIRKIDSFAIGGAGVAVGGAGDMDLIESVKHQLEQALRREPPTPENADAWMESFAKNIWKTALRALTQGESSA